MKLLKRRIIPCLLAAAMVLGNAAPAVTHAEPAATVQSEETGTVSDFPFSSFKGEDLTDTGNGIRVSEYEGDHFAVTDTWAKYFSMEADVTVESGFNPLFLIGVKDRDNVSQAWFGMGINRDSTNDYNNDANSAKIRVFTVGDCGGSVDAFKKLDIEDPEELAMLQKTEYHYKVTVTPDQYIRFYLDGELAVEAYAPGYSGGYVGIGSWKGSVVFNNIRFQNYEVDQFSFQNNGNGEFSEAEGVYTVGRGGGDHHVVSDVYAEGPFTYEADIEITDGWNAMLTFGIANRENAGSDAWYAAGPDRKTGDGEDYDGHARVFSVRGSLDLDVHTEMSPESIEKTSYHYKVTMDSSNTIRYYVDGELLVRANDPKYEGGYLGLLTWDAEAKFSNVKITLGEPYVEPEEAGNFQTNLEGLRALSGSWVETKDGWRGSGNAGVTFNNTDRRIMISWMVDIGYPFQTGDVTDPYNGALTIPYEMELKEIDGKLQIVQYPVKELESLRGAEHNFDGTTVTEDTPNILKDVQLNMAEIRTTIDVGDASEVGFKLRTGNNQNTVVRYNAVTGMLTLDRTNSGANPTDWFNGTYSKKIDLVDGKLDLTMYLDWSSLEMFAEDGRYEYTALIFPDSDSSGMEFYVKGGTAKIEKLSIYELDSIYRDDPEVETPDSVSVVSGADTYYAGDQFTVSAVATPTQAALRGVDHWEVSDASVAEILEQSDRAAVLKALKGGTVTVSAIGGDGGVIGSLDITVQVSDFRTNLDGWTVIGGSWNETTEGLEGSGSGNSPVISGVRASDFEYEATVKYTEGNVGTALIFRAKDDLSVYYTVDICVRDQRARILKFHRDPETGSSRDWTLGEAYTFEPTEDQVYHLKVVTEGDLIRFYLNGELAVETCDSESLEGKFGLNVCDATAVFQDVYYTSAELPFEDVSEDDWYYDAVHYVYSKRVMTGLDPTSFKPLNTLLRAEFATTLYRMSGSPEVEYSDRFPDVHEDSWFVDPVLWAAENGIVTGYSQGPLAGYFDPAATIQRQQMAVMLYRYANFMGYDTSETASFEGYVDGDKVDEFAEEAMAWAVGSGMISGKYEQTVLDPQGSATRAECATMLQRFIEKYVDVQN